MFVSSNPPVSLLIGRYSFAPSCRVIAIGWLVVKRCTSLIPVMDSAFKVKLANF